MRQTEKDRSALRFAQWRCSARRNSGERIIRWILVVTFVSATFAATEYRAAFGDPPSRDFRALFNMIVDRSVFQEVCGLLNLDEDQRKTAESRYDEYYDAVRTVDAETYEKMVEVGLGQIQDLHEEARQARQPIRDYAERTETLWQSVHRQMLLGQRRSDELLDRWLDVLREDLREGQQARFEPIPSHIRRRCWRRRQDYREGNLPLFHVVDIRDLVEAAVDDDGELACIRRADTTQAEFQCRCETRIQPILNAYERQLDSILIDLLGDQRRFSPGPTATAKDRHAYEQHRLQSGRSRFVRWDAISRTAADQIAQMLAEYHGEAVRSAWHDRFCCAQCPQLMSERWPDRMVEWLRVQPGSTQEQLALADAVYDDYVLKRDRLQNQALQIGLRAQRRFLTAMGTEPSQLRFARRVVALRKLISQTIVRFGQLLTPQQEKALRQTLDRWHYPIVNDGLSFHSGPLFGPSLRDFIVEALDVGYEPPPRVIHNPPVIWDEQVEKYHKGAVRGGDDDRE